MNEFPGFTHVVVTVSDLPRSNAWYADLLGSAVEFFAPPA